MKKNFSLLVIGLFIFNIFSINAYASEKIASIADSNQNSEEERLFVPKEPIAFWRNSAKLAHSKLPLASDCLLHSAGPVRAMGTPYKPSTLSYSASSSYSKKIQSTNAWKRMVSDAKSYFNNKTGSVSKKYYVSVESNDNADVFLALHTFTVTASVKNKSLNGNYTINFDIYDYYDFKYEDAKYLSAVNIINNLAYAEQTIGVLKNFDFRINGIKISATASNNTSNNSGYSRVLKVTNPLMYGNDIKKVQAKLNQLGYNAGTADGYYGNNTKNAVIRFQKAKGISADGMVGQTTWNKLFSSSSGSSSSSNSGYSRVLKVTSPLMYGNDVKKVQNRLNQLGYNAGTADGYYGNNTKNAVIRFQKAKGISADGMVVPTTWNKLF